MTGGEHRDGRSPLRRAMDEASGIADNAVFAEWVASVIAQSKRIAVNKTDAAEALGVSVEFFDEHVAPEVHRVRRGRRTIYPLSSLLWWLWLNGEPPTPGRRGPADLHCDAALAAGALLAGILHALPT